MPKQGYCSRFHVEDIDGFIVPLYEKMYLSAEHIEGLVDSLLNRDEYMLFADYQAYVDCQDIVSKAFQDSRNWTRMSILNVARSGKFSSDRSIKEYCNKIWKVRSLNKKGEI